MARYSWWAPIIVGAALVACGEPTYDFGAAVEVRRDVIWRLEDRGTLEARRQLARVMLEETDEQLGCAAAGSLERSSVATTEHPIAEMKEAYDAMLRDAWARTKGPLIGDRSRLICVSVILMELFRHIRGPGTTELIVHFLAAEEPVHAELVSIQAAVGLKRPEHRAAALPQVQRLVASGDGTPRQRRWWLITCAELERALDVDPATSPCAAADFDRHWASRRHPEAAPLPGGP